MVIGQGTTIVPLTIKYKKYSETDVSTKQQITNDYKIGLFVKDREVVIKHKYKNKLNIDKQIHDKIIENDERDIIRALDVFCQRFTNNILNIDTVNAEYLLSPRRQLTKKLHKND